MQQPGKVEVQWEPWISEGWHMFAERWQVWVLHTLIFIAAMAVVVVPLYVMVFVAAINAEAQGSTEPPPALILLYLILYPYFFIIGSFFAAGGYHTAMKQLRGEPISVGDLFGGGRYLLRMMGVSLLFGIVMMLGFVACIIPGFLVMGMWFLALPLAVGHNLGPVEALSASFAVTRTNLLMFTLFAFVIYLIAGAGAYACGVGALVTYPLWFTITTIAYRDCFGVPGARRFGAATPSAAPGYNPSYGDAPPGYTPPPPPSFGTVACPQCQAMVSANASFCPRCGKLLR
jgi:hypothetical protein